MNIKKLFLLGALFNSFALPSFHVMHTKELQQSVSEVNLPIESQRYLASFLLLDDDQDLYFELFVVSAREKDDRIFVQLKLFKNEEGILILDSTPIIVLTWEEETQFKVANENGFEWTYTFYADLVRHTIKVNEVIKSEELLQEWSYEWDIESNKKTFFDSFFGDGIDYYVFIEPVYLHNTDCIAFQWKVLTIENDIKKIIGASTIESQWGEECSIIITDKNNNNWTYTFTAEQW